MAQAAFFVNELKIMDKGKFLLIEGKRKCANGQVIEQVLLTVPAEFKRLFRTFEPADFAETRPGKDDSAAVTHRLKRYFENN